jgi:hypothetical protein
MTPRPFGLASFLVCLSCFVGLASAAPVRIESLYPKPDWKTGAIEAAVNVWNVGPRPAKGSLSLSVVAASGGETLDLSPANLASADGGNVSGTKIDRIYPRPRSLSVPLSKNNGRLKTAGGGRPERLSRSTEVSYE